ncbi:small COPII coat GTPase sar1 [Acrasis kona]|uniref:Small COPII coat GTPase sar1 n=1 Tax=Acrasis kona TaxID=1008807 RepID=A0AAW2YNI8_9EUKA
MISASTVARVFRVAKPIARGTSVSPAIQNHTLTTSRIAGRQKTSRPKAEKFPEGEMSRYMKLFMEE